MLLAVDIGNSTIGFGLFLEPVKSNKLFIKKTPTYQVQPAAAYKKIIAEFIRQNAERCSENIDAIVSSVVPSVDQPITSAIKDVCGKSPLIVSHKIKSGLTFNLTHPEEIGADRIANAVAGLHYFNKPVATVDLGTATTITVVGRKQTLLGGAILPGIKLMQEALQSGTARLPLTPLKKPEKVLGKNTASAITSGVIYGTAGAVEKLIKSMEKELGFGLELVLTGGCAEPVFSLIKRECISIPNLTIEGLRLIYLKEV